MFRIFSLYHLALFKFIFKSKLKKNSFDQSVYVFFAHQTYRFPKKTSSDNLFLIKMTKRLAFAQFKKQIFFTTGINSTHAIFDGNLKAASLRINYVQRLDDVKINSVFGREELIKRASFLLSVFIVIFLAISFPLLFLISLFTTDKIKIALWLLNLVEAMHLNKIISLQKIKTLYFFNCYENDANLLAYSLMKNNIRIEKIPSEVPLQFWNKILVANSLNICFKYQQDEYETYKETIFVDTIKNWIPENSLQLEPFYSGRENSPSKNTIGFYSSGMWLRAAKGRIDLKDNALENEKYLLQLLIDFTKTNPLYKLVVFLHPIEKAEPEKTKNHYESFNSSLTIANILKNNNEQFYNADVAVTLYSTLSYERLFWGFKTLIYPLGHAGFPLQESNFKNVCLTNETELTAKLLTALQQDNITFFKQNGIDSYTYNNYPFFQRN
ncbi:MAG: hypothetical protein JWO32_1887 [Bacteroidetes bacterium]|nr:hypothetical protein [Bacteroidota bacterium]